MPGLDPPSSEQGGLDPPSAAEEMLAAASYNNNDDDDNSRGNIDGKEALALSLTTEMNEAMAASPPPPPPSSSSACLTLLSSFRQRYGRTTLTILFWYLLSNTIILITKWLFTNHFPFPLTVTSVSNAASALWAAAWTYCCCCCQSRSAKHEECEREEEGPLSRHTITRYVLPIGLATGMEIACSNLALKILSVSFGTILKGAAPIWTFGWGLIFGVETFGSRLAGCLVLMALGIALASLGEGDEFDARGFGLQLLSGCLGGLRWAMTHKLLLNDDDEDNGEQHHRHRKISPLRAILYTSPT
eukprot:CAMPEP_0183707962 /NCGR_PEP_ID=MMETSP0737-20130205/4375_1 /TAXON_ID=385413 /ORGANISM="Thalassiosira miniscula, Strain CCMP1093" /LENGTH=301 /DNA_ID=CAMNT_0025935729 /DNA_START=32 /DNA_END=933 /DNA_ORIENTATION=-